jgi:Fe-S cluster assembly protein SufD
MSSVVERQETYLAEYERFAKVRNDAAPEWLRALRGRAAARFGALGFPTVRNEDWRFTNVSPIAETAFRMSDGVPTNAAEMVRRVSFAGAAARLVILNGRFSPELSSLGDLPVGVTAIALTEAIARNHPACAQLERSPIEDRAFVALNTAFLYDGVLLQIPQGLVLDAPIHIVVLGGGAGKIMTHPRIVVAAGANSQAAIAQTFLGGAGEAHFTNALTSVALDENATLDFCNDQRETEDAYHVSHLQVDCARNSTFRAQTVTLGGRLIRNDVVAVLGGEGAHVALDGCYLADGARLVDNHTTIDHATPHCTSHELYKGILDGKARAVFNGRIIVRQDAQKTDAKQTNRALLLSDEAQINSNPQLEIFADDVKCTHGAAIGQLDDEALFYLRARGLTAKAARDLLIRAYAGEILARIPIEPLRKELLRELFVELDRDLADHR